MPNIYDYVRHPRLDELHASHPPKTVDQRRLHHDNPIVRFNSRLGLFITLVVGTMWCAYLFTAIALVSLPAAIRSADPIIIIAWIAQTFLQLVLLPIIIVGQNIQAKAADARAAATYKDAEAVLKEAEQIQEHLLAQDNAISSIVERLEALTAGGGPKAP